MTQTWVNEGCLNVATLVWAVCSHTGGDLGQHTCTKQRGMGLDSFLPAIISRGLLSLPRALEKWL